MTDLNPLDQPQTFLNSPEGVQFMDRHFRPDFKEQVRERWNMDSVFHAKISLVLRNIIVETGLELDDDERDLVVHAAGVALIIEERVASGTTPT